MCVSLQTVGKLEEGLEEFELRVWVESRAR